MEVKFVNVHEHTIYVAISKMTEYKKIFKLSGYKKLKENEEMKISLINTYYYIKCKRCKNSFINSDETCKFIISENNIEGLINSFNENQVIESVSFENRPGINLMNDKNFFSEEFYKIKFVPRFDDFTIYIGTEDEKKNYFHKRYLELKEKIESREEEFKNNKDKLEKREKKLDEYKGSIIFKEQKSKNEVEGKYDVVIDINSILSLYGKGWKIEYPKGKEEYEKKIKKKSIIIGVLGNRNKGKSFILEKLSTYNIEQGFSIETKGISVKFSETDDNFLTILDSAGQEVPLLNSENIQNNEIKDNKENKEKNEINVNIENEEIKENNEIKEEKEEKEEKEVKKDNEKNNVQDNKNIHNVEEFNKDSLLEQCLRDKLITEKFIEDFIIVNSNILVLVVGSITLNEQKLMKRIKNSLKKNQELFVIHNLRNITTKEDVDKYIENILKKLFGLQMEENDFFDNNKGLNNKYFVEKDKTAIHLIFVNDFCPVAKYYNDPTCDFIKSKLKGVTERAYFSVIEKCKEFFIKSQEKFLVEDINMDDFTQENDKLVIKNKKISLKKVFVDEIGETIINDSDIPKYNYYTQEGDLIVNIELPGPKAEILTRSEVQGGFQVFFFQGKTADFTSEIKEKKGIISKNIKKPKEFQFMFRISLSQIKLLLNEEKEENYYEKQNVNGIITYKYHIYHSSKKSVFK